MRRGSVVAVVCLCLCSLAVAAQVPAYRDASRPVDERVRILLGRMTLEEKFWQLFMIPGSLDDPAHDYSNGVFGLQISPAARGHAERINLPRECVPIPTEFLRLPNPLASQSGLNGEYFDNNARKARRGSRGSIGRSISAGR